MSDGDETKAARLLPADGGSSSELIGQWIGDGYAQQDAPRNGLAKDPDKHAGDSAGARGTSRARHQEPGEEIEREVDEQGP